MVLFNIIAFSAEFVEMCIVADHAGSGVALFVGKVSYLLLPFFFHLCFFPLLQESKKAFCHFAVFLFQNN